MPTIRSSDSGEIASKVALDWLQFRFGPSLYHRHSSTVRETASSHRTRTHAESADEASHDHAVSIQSIQSHQTHVADIQTRIFQPRVTLCSLNGQRQVRHKQTTDIVPLSLDKNQELPLLYLDNALDYPLLISLNLLLVSPCSVQPDGDCSAPSISNIGSKVVCSSDMMYS